MLLSLLIFFAQSPAPETTLPRKSPPLDHVILISVDGLRSDALLINGGDGLPNFQRLMYGAHTLNARCDPHYSVTLPNHTDMLTGRLVKGEGGHGWTSNATPPPEGILVDAEGEIFEGVYHHTSAAGIDDAFLASKQKFLLFTQSWNPSFDMRVMDVVLVKNDVEAQMDLVFQMLDEEKHARSFTFLHLRGPDDAGHKEGWDMTPGSHYLKAVQDADRQIGRILTFLDEHKALRSTTAVVVTADHGGGIPHKNHHGHGMMWVNTIIPFFIDLPESERIDLYELCATTRRDPGLDPVANDEDKLPPIRNADAANLCLALLGLDSIPGSTVNVSQDFVGALYK